MRTFLVAFAALCMGPVARAAYTNENSLLIGERAAGMGGAATAVTGDAAGAPFYNPGTMAFLNGSAFSAAVGVYKKFDMVYGEQEDFTKAPLRVNQGFFRSLPASTGSVIRWDKVPEWTFALSVVVPDYEQFKGDLRNDDTNVSTLTYTDESLWVGFGAAHKISEREGLGVTVYYTARNLQQAAADRSLPSANHTILFSEEKTVVENALVPVAGYYHEVSEKFAWGAAIRFPAVKVQGHATLFSTLIDADAGTGHVSTTTTGFPEKAARVVIPAKLTLGISYFYDPSLLFAVDASLREGVSYSDLEDEAYSVRIRHRAIANMAIGAEKTFLDWFKIRLGAYTNFSSQPDPDPSLNRLQEDHVDMLGFSANFVFIAGQKIAYTFGGYYTGGRGLSIQRINQQYEVVPKTANIFTMLVGTSFSF